MIMSSAASKSFHDEEIKHDHSQKNTSNEEKQKNDKDQMGKSTDRIRSIPQIKSYLEHFIPELSLSTTIKCFFLKPISICANIYFIIYQFYYIIFTDAIAHESVYQNHILEICKKIVVLIELCGLIFLFMCIFITYLKSSYAELIDCVRFCGSWSTFQLFYKFQPLSLMSYLSIILKHHQSRLHGNASKFELWEKLQRDLKYEIEQGSELLGINNDKMKDMKEHLKFLTAIHKSQDVDELKEKLDNNKFVRMSNAQKRSALGYHTRASAVASVSEFLDQWTPKNYHAFFARMIHLSSWFVCISLLTTLLIIGLLSFLLKLSMFGFISTKAINEWDITTQYIPFILFCNQIWNAISVDAIRVQSVYKFLFIDSSVRSSRYVSQRMAILDSIIKVGLWQNFGYRGFLIAVSLNAEIVQKIIVKKSTDLSMFQLIQYKDELKKRKGKSYNSHYWISMQQNDVGGNENYEMMLPIIKNENNHQHQVDEQKEIDANWPCWDRWKNRMKQHILKYADWLTISHKRQPNHPYTSVRTEIDDYYNSLDSMSEKVLVNIHSQNIGHSVYNEYKLAVKSIKDDVTTVSISDHEENDAESTFTLCDPSYNDDWTRKKNTLSKLKTNVIKKSKLRTAMMPIEMRSFYSSVGSFYNSMHNIYEEKYYPLHENKLVHKIVLFEWMERYMSFFAPFAVIIFALIAFGANTLSIIMYPNVGTDDQCLDSEVNIIVQIRRLNMAFMSCCVIGIIYFGIFGCLIKVQTKNGTRNVKNCFKIGSDPQFLRISSIIGLFLWLILAVLCSFRFIDFMRLHYKCENHIIHEQTVLFVSIIGNVIFAIFMTIIAWITLLSYVWLALIVFFIGTHLFFLYLFYVAGWNFTVHSIAEFTLLFNENIMEEHKFADHCFTRFIFVSIISVGFCIYCMIGMIELFFAIRKYRKILQKIRLFRIVIISIMYLSAIAHYIITNIIEELTDDITDTCQKSHFDIDSRYYSKKGQYLFLLALVLDLALFGKLFKSWKIIMDPLFCLSQYVYYKTHETFYCLIALLFTIAALGVLGVLFTMSLM